MKFPRLFSVLIVIIMLASFMATPVFALGVHLQDGPQPTSIDYLVQLVFGIAVTVPGFTTLGVVLVNLMKIPGWVKDGNTQLALNIFNVLSAVVIGALTLFLPNVDIPGLDANFGRLAGVLTVLLPTFVLLYKWLAPYIHQAIRGVPGIGHSFTLAKARTK